MTNQDKDNTNTENGSAYPNIQALALRYPGVGLSPVLGYKGANSVAFKKRLVVTVGIKKTNGTISATTHEEDIDIDLVSDPNYNNKHIHDIGFDRLPDKITKISSEESFAERQTGKTPFNLHFTEPKEVVFKLEPNDWTFDLEPFYLLDVVRMDGTNHKADKNNSYCQLRRIKDPSDGECREIRAYNTHLKPGDPIRERHFYQLKIKQADGITLIIDPESDHT